MQILGACFSFWGLEVAYEVNVSKEPLIIRELSNSKKIVLVTLYFQRPWFSKYGPMGFRVGHGLEKMSQINLLAQNNPWWH